MQNYPSSAAADLAYPTSDSAHRGPGLATKTRLKRLTTSGGENPGSIGAGAEIFRRLERRPRRPKWVLLISLFVLATVAAAGLVAYNIPPPAAAQAHFIVPGD